MTFFAGTNFRELFEKLRNPRKLIPAKIDTNKILSLFYLAVEILPIIKMKAITLVVWRGYE